MTVKGFLMLLMIINGNISEECLGFDVTLQPLYNKTVFHIESILPPGS